MRWLLKREKSLFFKDMAPIRMLMPQEDSHTLMYICVALLGLGLLITMTKDISQRDTEC